MKKEQLDGKFIVCRTQNEIDFIKYWANKLLNVEVRGQYYAPVVFRLSYGSWGYCNDPGDYVGGLTEFTCEKEEECSVLFGNLVKRWLKNGRT